MKFLFAVAVGLLAPTLSFAADAQLTPAQLQANLSAAQAAYATAQQNYQVNVQVCLDLEASMAAAVARYNAARAAAATADANFASAKKAYEGAPAATGVVGPSWGSVPFTGALLALQTATQKQKDAHKELFDAEYIMTGTESVTCGVTPTRYNFVDPSWASYSAALQLAKENLDAAQVLANGVKPANPDMLPGAQWGH